MTLTPREQRVLTAAFQNMLDSAGGDFGFTDEIVAECEPMTPQAVGGVLTSLQSKGLIHIDEPHTVNDSDIVIQVYARDDLREALQGDGDPESLVQQVVAEG